LRPQDPARGQAQATTPHTVDYRFALPRAQAAFPLSCLPRTFGKPRRDRPHYTTGVPAAAGVSALTIEDTQLPAPFGGSDGKDLIAVEEGVGKMRAALAGLVSFLNRNIGWQSSLLVLPPIYLMYRSYRLYLEKLETEKKHAEQVSILHLRTIEALALAIDAKDHTTHEHLQRVRVYATEIAKELGLPNAQLEALKAAALLHDIGKLAVPEHILSKPGRLTAEEFEKMKIHPSVGAEILERVKFPYPVAPIVRCHHEKWDGTGYPRVLKGESIPLAARLFALVDSWDALTSDRPYRAAWAPAKVAKHIKGLAGTHLAPEAVDLFFKRPMFAAAGGNGS